MNTNMVTDSDNIGYHFYYPGGRLFSILFNIFAVGMPLFTFGSFIYSIVRGKETNLILEIVVITLFSFVFEPIIFFITANYLPDIWAYEEGLYISFIWKRLLVRWEDIIDFKPTYYNLPSNKVHWVVITHSLTPFHRLYGFFYALSPYPCFIIHTSIKGRRELFTMIYKRKFLERDSRQENETNA